MCRWFSLSEDVAQDALSGKTFIDQCFKRLFPLESKILPFHWRSVKILAPEQRSQQNANMFWETWPLKEDVPIAFICIAKLLTLPAENEAPVIVATEKRTDWCPLDYRTGATAWFILATPHLIFEKCHNVAETQDHSRQHSVPQCCCQAKNLWQGGNEKGGRGWPYRTAGRETHGDNSPGRKLRGSNYLLEGSLN